MTGPRRFRLPAGPWRVAVVDASMRPAIEPGDWLLADPTTTRWPRRGTVIVFREPGSGALAIKRVAARPGDWVPFADGWLQLAPDEAWLIGDATDAFLATAGEGQAVDSRRYGPVPLDALVARAWFCYWPGARIGRLAPGPDDLLARGRDGRIPVLDPEVPGAGAQPAGSPPVAMPDTLS